jgi:nucleoside-diphosphate-sugar epimerase
LIATRSLITGGTGFIGSRLARACVARGHQVTVLGQANTPAEAANVQQLEAEGIRVVNASVAEPASVRAAVRGVDLVFHLAAAQHEMNVGDDHFRDVNVGGVRHVLDAALEAGVRRVVHGSTIGVYGSYEGVIDEETPCRPDNIYGVTKLEGERLAASYADRLPVVIVRIPEVYGPGDRRLLKLFRAIQHRRFVRIGSGLNLHHPMYVDDLVAELLTLSADSHAPGQILLLAGKDAVSTNEMIDAIAAAVGARPPRIRVPLAPFLAAATMMELGLRPLGIQPPLHRRRMDFFRKGFTLKAARAAALGAIAQTGFREGVRTTADWYRSAGLL